MEEAGTVGVGILHLSNPERLSSTFESSENTFMKKIGQSGKPASAKEKKKARGRGKIKPGKKGRNMKKTSLRNEKKNRKKRAIQSHSDDPKSLRLWDGSRIGLGQGLRVGGRTFPCRIAPR
eukprot:1261392-Amorphochlora_amoeboformis.AAC.1